MSTPESPFSPSRQVERIREILVGRQLAAVGRRLERLERGVAAGDDGLRLGGVRVGRLGDGVGFDELVAALARFADAE